MHNHELINKIGCQLFYKLADRFTHTEPVLPSAGAVWLAIGLGVGLTGILVALNPAWFL